jgi:4-amino-4-deoxy-L-arabinose transferase-like glycosyltransferase
LTPLIRPIGVESAVAFAVLLGFVVILQLLGGAYASGFGGYPDEPAHLVTSMMIREFALSLDFRHPWQFAQQYYYHYPKVAIGWWPPVFYAMLGVWFLIVGASRATALAFIAIIAAATASVIYLTGRRLIGRWAGILAAVLFVASPLVQESSARVMTEHLSTLGMLVSALCFARLARTGRTGDGLLFGTAAAIAILTHGNAWALGLMPGISIALANRWWLLRRPGLWLAVVPVLVLCVPWYAVTLGMTQGGWAPSNFAYRMEAIQGFTWYLYLGMGLAVLIFAVIGAWETTIRVKPRAAVAPEWAALGGLIIATFILYAIVPIPIDGRFVVVVLPVVVLFAAAGVNAIAQRLGARLRIVGVRAGLALALIAAFSWQSFALPVQLRNGGYEVLVQNVETRVANVPQNWLISAGATGEGCLVAAIALREMRPHSHVMRGKTLLGGGDWLWQNMQDRFDTPAKLARLLDDLPVSIIVIDDDIPADQQRPYQLRLKKLMVTDSKKWELVGSYPQIRGAVLLPNSLHVYARRPIASLATAPPSIRLDLLKTLMVRGQLR